MTYEDFIRPREIDSGNVDDSQPVDAVSHRVENEGESTSNDAEGLRVYGDDAAGAPRPQEEPSLEPSVELDVQKAVVEELAADKAEQSVKIEDLERENGELKKAEGELKSKISDLTALIEDLRQQLLKVGDILSQNTETAKSNQVTLLERNPELQDRFDGETYDHVLEVLKEARDAAEKDGRARRAQLLESVLAANEPSGKLLQKREELEKLFTDNQNVINGEVIAALDKLGITYKLGDKYLLVGEIIKRSY